MTRKKDETKTTKKDRRSLKGVIKDNLLKREKRKRRKVKQAIFENSLERLDNNFTVRITDDKIIIQDEVTLLEFTPEEMGEVVIERDGEKILVSIEKEIKE